MQKLTQSEKQAVLTCVYHVEKMFECDRCKLEVEYYKLNRYDEDLEKKIRNAKDVEEFYANLGEKLKEILKWKATN